MSARQRKRRGTRRREHSVKSPTRRRLLAAGGLTAGATLAFSGAAHAAPETLTVGSNADTTGATDCASNPNNTDCTLRQAITDANANAGADTIVFASALSGQTITMTADPVPITEAVSVQGPGASQLTIDGAGSYRDFTVQPTTSGDLVSISGLTLTNGYTAASGGAVYNNDADLTVSNSLITNSYATSVTPKGRGGGLYTNSGPLSIVGSTLSGNHAYYGGGVGTYSGNVTVQDSRLTGNYADGNPGSGGSDGYGGGINAHDANVTVTGSTIDHNTATYDGGGIYSANGSSGGDLTIENSTIADNRTLNDDGGGVWMCCGEGSEALTVVDSTVTGNTAATHTGGLESYLGGGPSPVLENSIVSGNTSGTKPPSDDVYASSGSYWQASFDLVGVNSYLDDLIGNRFGSDPKLGPLQDNGGPTLTRAPLCGSPAIDQGKAFGYSVDQRGLTRPVDLPDYPNSAAAGADGSDIGAVELQTSPGTVCVTPSGGGNPTGQRAGALAKCKRKYKRALKNKRAHDALTRQVKHHLKKKLRKCKRRASQLPL